MNHKEILCAQVSVHHKNSVTANVLSNFMAKAVQAIGLFIFTPIYLNLLGLEAIGIIAIWNVLRSLFILLDFGMSTSLNRQIASSGNNKGEIANSRAMLHSFEVISWAVAVIGSILFAISSPWLVHTWIHQTTTPENALICALILLGGASAFNLPAILYQGGLMGHERQVSMNVTVIGCSILRDVGAWLILTYVIRSIPMFFVWQLVVTCLQCVIQRTVLLHTFGNRTAPCRFSFRVFKPIAKFTLGVGCISLTIMVIGLADRVVLSRLVSLEQLGIYGLAQTLAGGILIMASPFSTAALPRLTALKSMESNDFAKTYYDFSQFVSFLVIPLSVTLFVYPELFMYVWTGNAQISPIAGEALRYLSLGTGLNALLYIPLQLQYTAGWTSLTLRSNIISIIFYVPLLIILVLRKGICGAAIAMVALMICQFIFIPEYAHQKILKGKRWSWHLENVFKPSIPAIIFAFILLKYRFNLGDTRLLNALQLGVVWLAVAGLTMCFTPRVRWQISRVYRKLRFN